MPATAASSCSPSSPCVGICRIHPEHGWCEGCWRSLAEIADWSRSSDDAKRIVLAALPARQAAHAEPVSVSGTSGASA